MRPALNKFGADDWKVVTMITIKFSDCGTRSIVATLKRKIAD